MRTSDTARSDRDVYPAIGALPQIDTVPPPGLEETLLASRPCRREPECASWDEVRTSGGPLVHQLGQLGADNLETCCVEQLIPAASMLPGYIS